MHGWGDDVVPLQNVQRFAARHRAALHVVNADHGLSAAMDTIEILFAQQLRRQRSAA